MKVEKVKGDEVNAAEALSAQYAKALAGTREILLFGAMMDRLPTVLSRQNGQQARNAGGRFDGGLKAWLAEHCPEINYHVAYGFLQLARAMAKALALPAECDLPRLLAAPAEELSDDDARVRETIDEAIEGKSRRQLEFDFGIRAAPLPTGGARPGAGRKPILRQAGDAGESSIHKAAVRTWGEVRRNVSAFFDNSFDSALSVPELRAAIEQLETWKSDLAATLKTLDSNAKKH